MHLVLAQATEITQAAKSWGDQLPALGLGLLGFGILVSLFLRRLKEMGEESRKEREAREIAAREERESRDALFSITIREVSERADKRAAECHAVQSAATERERQIAEVLGEVRGALDRSATVTVDVGRAVEEARREIERRRV